MPRLQTLICMLLLFGLPSCNRCKWNSGVESCYQRCGIFWDDNLDTCSCMCGSWRSRSFPAWAFKCGVVPGCTFSTHETSHFNRSDDDPRYSVVLDSENSHYLESSYKLTIESDAQDIPFGIYGEANLTREGKRYWLDLVDDDPQFTFNFRGWLRLDEASLSRDFSLLFSYGSSSSKETGLKVRELPFPAGERTVPGLWTPFLFHFSLNRSVFDGLYRDDGYVFLDLVNHSPDPLILNIDDVRMSLEGE